MLHRAAAVAGMLVVSCAAPAIAQEDIASFYRGKTIQLLVGAHPGISYDLAGRLLASHITRHIPGNPGITVENMPGASSLLMTNHLYHRARRDGTVIGAMLNNVLLEPKLKVMSQQGISVQFDLAKLNWLGSPIQEPQLLFVWHTTGVKTLAELREKPLTVGGTSRGADNNTLPLAVNKLLGSKMNIVLGYRGPIDVFIAMERGEVRGVTASYSSLMTNRMHWVKDGMVNILLQFGSARLPDLPQVPTAIEMATDPAARELFEFIGSKFVLARPYALPPEVPAERVRALRAAFDATMKDPAFLADAQKAGLNVDPVGGEEMARLIQKIEDAPQRIVDQMRDILSK